MTDTKSKEQDKLLRGKTKIIASGRGYSWKVPAKNAYPASPASQTQTDCTSVEQAYHAQMINSNFENADLSVGG